MKKLFFTVVLSAMAIICLVVGASCKKKNAKTSLYSDYEESVASVEISAIESEKPSDTAGATESVKTSDEASVSESVTSEESSLKPKSGKSSETSESIETTETTESPESTEISKSSETGEETKPSESTDTTETPESPEVSDNDSESISESNSEIDFESHPESVVESNSESIVESISESVESSASEDKSGESVSESQSETTVKTDSEPATDDPWGDSSESGEGETGYDELSDSGDSSESGEAVEDAKTVLDIVSGTVEELAIEADEAEFTAEFFSILKDKGYTHFKFKAKSDGVDDYALSGNKYPSDNGAAEIRVEAYRFFDKSVCLRSGGATYIRIYDFVFFSSEETENLTFGDNGYLCYEDEDLVYADYGDGNDYGFRFPDKYFEFEKGLLNKDNEIIIGNVAVTYKTEDGCHCEFQYGAFDDNGKLIGFNDASELVSDTSIYVSRKKLSEKYVVIRPEVRSPIVFNKCELIYSGELSDAKCRPDKTGDVINVKYNSGEPARFYLCLKNAEKVKIIVETEKAMDILLSSNNGTSCYMDKTNGKYEKIITLPKTGVINIDIEKCNDFCLRYEKIVSH